NDRAVCKYAGENRWKSGESLRSETHQIGQPIFTIGLGKKNRSENSEWDAQKTRQGDDNQCPFQSVSETTSVLKRSGQKLRENRKAQFPAASNQQHENYGEQWNQRQGGHQSHQGTHRYTEQSSRPAQRSVQLGKIHPFKGIHIRTKKSFLVGHYFASS